MKGRFEGDWIDGKYDGHGVETWAKGSRYYTGDVYDMAPVYILPKVVVDMLENSNLVSKMAVVVTISEMVMHIVGSILQTRCMVLVCIDLEMVIGMKELDTKEGHKGLVCIYSGMVRHRPATGKALFSVVLVSRPYLLDHL